jgi:hypothetical protein
MTSRERAAGVTPEMRPARAMLAGRSADSFSITSRDNPGMAA